MKLRPLFALLAGLLAQPAWSADLLDVYRDALAHDARYQAARAALEAGREKAAQGRAGLLPALGVSAASSWNQVEVKQGDFRSEQDYNANNYALQLSQPLFRWDNWIASRQGELQSALAESQFRVAEQDLALRVAAAYFDVLNAQDGLTAVQSLREAAGQQLELAKKSFEVGTVTVTDVHEAQSRYDLATAQEIAAVNALEVARQSLAVLTGKGASELAGLRKGASLGQPQPADAASWVSAAEKGSPAVQAREIGFEIAAQQVERARAGHLPTVDLVASHGRSKSLSTSSGLPSTSYADTVGVQFNLPLYAGGAVSSRMREAAALREQSRAELEEARRAAGLGARQSFLGVTSGLAKVKALEAAELSSRSALEANRLGYEVGVRINIDVLNAQSQLSDTLQQLARARYETLLAELQLKAATGSLDERALAEINGLLGR